MDLKRFFSDGIDYESKTAVLTGDEFYHAVKVTRHKIGYKLIICGDGIYDYYCTVEKITDDSLYAKIDSRELNETETRIPVTLYIGANKDLDTAVQKAVEMGASKIVPFTSAHCNTDKINVDRLNKIVLESSKQCGRARLAKVASLMTLKEALSVAKDTDIMFFYEFERTRKVVDCEFTHREISIFIGCEGGFSVEESELFSTFGAKPITLGKRILRVSTAVVAAMALVNSATGEM